MGKPAIDPRVRSSVQAAWRSTAKPDRGGARRLFRGWARDGACVRFHRGLWAWGIFQNLDCRIGVRAAARMTMTARQFGAAEAYRAALVDLPADEKGLGELLDEFVGPILGES